MPTVDQYAAIGDQEFDPQQTAGNTAIKRPRPSVPVLHAINQGLVAGRVLHQGAGRPDNPDRALLDSLGHTVHYDKRHSPETGDHLHRADFDTVLTPYVVNVLPPELRQSVYQDAARSVKPDGRVVIAARSHRSVKPGPGWVEHQDGHWVPNRGTWNFQRGYTPEELRDEARLHFEHVEIVPGAKEPMVVARRPRPINQPPDAGPEARYTWYADFLSRAGLTPRPFDEWQALEPERYGAQRAPMNRAEREQHIAGLKAKIRYYAPGSKNATALRAEIDELNIPTANEEAGSGEFIDDPNTYWRIHPRSFQPDELHQHHVSKHWEEGSDSDDAKRRGLSTTGSLASLAKWFAGWPNEHSPGRSADFNGAHLVQLRGTPSGDTPWEAHEGERLIHPTHLIASRPVEKTDFLDRVADVISNRWGGKWTHRNGEFKEIEPPQNSGDEPDRYRVDESRGYIACDLDGTLARWEPSQGLWRIGEPIPEMVARVKSWLAAGKDVRIFTARVYGPDAESQRRLIDQWCRQYIGRTLPITNRKDPSMYEFWDDRAIQVARNTGQPIGRFSMTAQEIDAAVKDWSPPTEAQREAENYRAPKINLHGLTISIETPRGERRRPEWPPVVAHYGRILGTTGADDEHLDVFVADHPESELVYVIDQEHRGGRWDEHKAILGCLNKDEARRVYKDSYDDGRRATGITAMTVEQFKEWIKSGDTRHRIAEQVSRYTADQDPTTEAEPTPPPTFEQEVEQVAERYNLTASEKAEMLDRYCAALAPRPRDLDHDLAQVARELDLTPAEIQAIRRQYEENPDGTP